MKASLGSFMRPQETESQAVVRPKTRSRLVARPRPSLSSLALSATPLHVPPCSKSDGLGQLHRRGDGRRELDFEGVHVGRKGVRTGNVSCNFLNRTISSQ